MNQNRILLILAGISGFVAVALGAYGSHVLRMQVDEKLIRSFDIASKYHFYHTIAIAAFAFNVKNKTGYLAAWLLLSGIVLFSGGIYVSILWNLPALTIITPFGGISFMAGWLFFAFSVYKDRK